ncbi:unnamed protein product [Miscanthus lutarioriparius]|uniref:LysM domain-containing protein n=1 Tax=Miscanthus lutarioriparius TaxID=422564 RepID=A0A811NA83_9POAL|nr:unnamed protein product [Miscanthus lutarioriparius]
MRAAPASLRLLPHLLLVAVPNAVSMSTLESCASSTACPALLSYTLYADLKLAELAALFAADPLAILAANAIDFAVPDPADRILPAGLPLRVPVPCACSDGICKATSVRYVARAGDTLASVAASVYGGLTTPDWIRDSNGMPEDAALDAGTTLFVPLHCACFGGVDSGAPAVYLTYVVAEGDTVPAIARRFRTTGNDLMSVNDMATADVAAGDIIIVPLPECASSFPAFTSDAGLTVANGTYAQPLRPVQLRLRPWQPGLVLRAGAAGGLDVLQHAVQQQQHDARQLHPPDDQRRLQRHLLQLRRIRQRHHPRHCPGHSSRHCCLPSTMVNWSLAYTVDSIKQNSPHQFPPLMPPPTSSFFETYLGPSATPMASEGGIGPQMAGMAPTSSPPVSSGPPMAGSHGSDRLALVALCLVANLLW